MAPSKDAALAAVLTLIDGRILREGPFFQDKKSPAQDVRGQENELRDESSIGADFRNSTLKHIESDRLLEHLIGTWNSSRLRQSGKHDYRQYTADFSQAVDELVPIHFRHQQVAEHQIEIDVFPHRLQRFAPMLQPDSPMSERLQHIRKHLAYRYIILHEENIHATSFARTRQLFA